MSKRDELLNKLVKKDSDKPSLDVTYEQKGIVIDQFADRQEGEKKDMSGRGMEETKKPINDEKNESSNIRKRVSFDIRIDLHKQLKMQALLQDKNIYVLIEEAVEKYLKEQQR